MAQRVVHEYEFPIVGKVAPGFDPEAPHDPQRDPWDEEGIYMGDDPWDGSEPLFSSLGVVSLNGAEETAALRATKGDPMVLQDELAKRAVKEVNGRPAKTGDFEVEDLFSKCPSKVRALWVEAFLTHNEVKADLRATFRKSHKRKLIETGPKGGGKAAR